MPILSSLAGFLGYGRGGGGGSIIASGGDQVTTYNGFKYHVFETPGNFTIESYPPDGKVEILVIGAGGGAGTYYYCGGSGAGGLVHVTDYPAASLVSSYGSTILADVAGAGAYNTDGAPSTFAGLTALGGGRGAGAYHSAGNGGSGGAGSLYRRSANSRQGTQPSQPQTHGGTLALNAGNPGGQGPGWPSTNDVGPTVQSPIGGAGGGGSRSGGTNYQPTRCGDGGVGHVFPQFTNAANPLLPSDGGFAGGGGGGAYRGGQISSSYRGYGGYYPIPLSAESPARYGAGDGAPAGPNHYGVTSGTARTGSGAGGPDYPVNTTVGGSGIVVIRYSVA